LTKDFKTLTLEEHNLHFVGLHRTNMGGNPIGFLLPLDSSCNLAPLKVHTFTYENYEEEW